MAEVPQNAPEGGVATEGEPASGASLNWFWEPILRPLADAALARQVVEVGSEFGLLTQSLLDHFVPLGGIVHAIDPQPQFDVEALEERHGEGFVMHRALSLEVLSSLGELDMAFVDGDHNYYTVLHELRALEQTARERGVAPPIVALHDVGWPYGRRDMYYDPETIPQEHRHPYRQLGLIPGQEELSPDGINADVSNAVHEGTPRNGVRTAVDDFLAQSPEAWRTWFLPGFHGLGILVPEARLSEPLVAALDELRSAEFLEEWAERLERARITGPETALHAALALQRHQLEERESQLADMRDQLGRLQGLEEQLLAAQQELAALPDLQLRLRQLARELDDARDAARAAREEARRLDERLTLAHRVYADVITSPSWRLTEPLRKAKQALNRA